MGTQRSQSVRVAVGSSNHGLNFQKPTGNHCIFALHRLQEKVKQKQSFFLARITSKQRGKKMQIGNYIHLQ